MQTQDHIASFYAYAGGRFQGGISISAEAALTMQDRFCVQCGMSESGDIAEFEGGILLEAGGDVTIGNELCTECGHGQGIFSGGIKVTSKNAQVKVGHNLAASAGVGTGQPSEVLDMANTLLFEKPADDAPRGFSGGVSISGLTGVEIGNGCASRVGGGRDGDGAFRGGITVRSAFGNVTTGDGLGYEAGWGQFHSGSFSGGVKVTAAGDVGIGALMAVRAGYSDYGIGSFTGGISIDSTGGSLSVGDSVCLSCGGSSRPWYLGSFTGPIWIKGDGAVVVGDDAFRGLVTQASAVTIAAGAELAVGDRLLQGAALGNGDVLVAANINGGTSQVAQIGAFGFSEFSSAAGNVELSCMDYTSELGIFSAASVGGDLTLASTSEMSAPDVLPGEVVFTVGPNFPVNSSGILDVDLAPSVAVPLSVGLGEDSIAGLTLANLDCPHTINFTNCADCTDMHASHFSFFDSWSVIEAPCANPERVGICLVVTALGKVNHENGPSTWTTNLKFKCKENKSSPVSPFGTLSVSGVLTGCTSGWLGVSVKDSVNTCSTTCARTIRTTTTTPPQKAVTVKPPQIFVPTGGGDSTSTSTTSTVTTAGNNSAAGSDGSASDRDDTLMAAVVVLAVLLLLAIVFIVLLLVTRNKSDKSTKEADDVVREEPKLETGIAFENPTYGDGDMPVP